MRWANVHFVVILLLLKHIKCVNLSIVQEIRIDIIIFNQDLHYDIIITMMLGNLRLILLIYFITLSYYLYLMRVVLVTKVLWLIWINLNYFRINENTYSIVEIVSIQYIATLSDNKYAWTPNWPLLPLQDLEIKKCVPI